MDVLVIGGSRFMGRQLAHRLVARGDRVTLLNRGTHDDGLGARAERLRCDRTTERMVEALAGRRFDAAIDFSAYVGADAERAVRALEGRVGHYVFVSTGQVYLVRCRAESGADGERASPWREEDYEGAVIARPASDEVHLANWEYGVGKRECEDLLASRADFPSTRVRIPMVHGAGDPDSRVARVVRALLAGGEVRVRRPHAPVRHVHAPTIATIFAGLLGDERAIGGAYNVAPDDTITVLGFYERVARHLGARVELVAVEGDAELDPPRTEDEARPPIGGRWMSCLDASRARRELGIAHPPHGAWLASVVDAAIATGIAPD